MTSGIPRDVLVLVDLSPIDRASRPAQALAIAQRLGARAPYALAIGLDLEIDAKGWIPGGDAWQQACEAVFARSADRGAHALILTGDVLPSEAALSDLIAVFDTDPMFGIVHPRFVDTDGIYAAAPSVEDPALDVVRTGVLPEEPDVFFVPEGFSPCTLIRWDLVASLPLATGPWVSLAGLVTEYAVRARRLGLRSVVTNRVSVTLRPLPRWSVIEPDAADRGRIHERFPEVAAAARFLSGRAQLETEQLLSCTIDDPRSLLIDAQNLNPVINGTSKAILGLTDGLCRVREGLPTTLWVGSDAATYHRIQSRYPTWTVKTGQLPEGPYAAALRLSQPWHIAETLQLDRVAAVSAYLMLDAIAWDVVYTAPQSLDPIWRFAAECADGLIFISDFSRQRFRRRFPVAPAVSTGVVHLSLDARDYAEQAIPIDVSPSEPFWFIVGNAYDHKHVTPTVDLLTRAFPTRSFVVLGDRAPQRGARVRRLHSGSTREPVMQAHYANAEIMIFPSFYEGFGLPIWNALAYGQTVVARDSALVRELAPIYRGPGRLITFDSDPSLISCLSKLVHGLDVQDLTLGSSGQRGVHGWTEAATAIDGFLRHLVAQAPASPLRRFRSLVSALDCHPQPWPAEGSRTFPPRAVSAASADTPEARPSET